MSASDPNRSARHPEFDKEQSYLNYAYDCLEEMKQSASRLAEAGGDPKAAAALRRLAERMVDRFEDANTGLCFGRMDMKSEETFYIGRMRVHGDGHSLVVMNWQAPAAAPFYTATPSKPGDVTLRRVFRTNGPQLLAIYDEHLVPVEIAEVAGEVTAGIDDPLLAELDRSRGRYMRDIVATIQSDQYRLITADVGKTITIQGGPGTGKTAVGLHRAAWLLYTHRRELETRGILVVGPNRAFMQYVSDVLPSLGEEAVDQSAIGYLTEKARARATEDRDVQRIKADPRMVAVVQKAVEDRIRIPSEPVRLQYNGSEAVLAPDEIAGLIDLARSGSRPYMREREDFGKRLRRALHDRYREVAPSAVAYEDFSRTLNQRGDYRSILDRIWLGLSATELIRQLLGSRERLTQAANGVMSKEEIELLYRQNPEKLEEIEWTESDLALIDEAEELLNGPPETYGHVIVDEAQDLTPMQLRMVERRSSGALTILGDIAQGTGVWHYDAWSELLAHLPSAKDEPPEHLKWGYRVPRQIMEIADRLLPYIAPGLPETEHYRDGNLGPAFLPITREFLAQEAAQQVAALLRSSEGTVGLIVADGILDEFRAALAEQSIEYGDAQRGQLGERMALMTPRLAKGLEFDHVVLVEPTAMLREALSDRPLRELYVAMTRATQQLVVVHSEPLPFPLDPESEPFTAPEAIVGTEPVEPEGAYLGPRFADALAYLRIARAGEARPGVGAGELLAASLALAAGKTEEEAIVTLLRASGGAARPEEVRRFFGPAVAEALTAGSTRPDAEDLAETLQELLRSTGPSELRRELEKLGTRE